MKKVSTGAISIAVATAILLSGCGAKPTPQIMTKSDAIKKMEVMKFDKEKELYLSSVLPEPVQLYGPFGNGVSGRGQGSGIIFQESDGSYIVQLARQALGSYQYDIQTLVNYGYKNFTYDQQKEVFDRLPSYKFDSIVAGDIIIPVREGQSSFRLPKNADISDIKVVFKINQFPKVYEPFDKKSRDYGMIAGMLVLTAGFAVVDPNFWAKVNEDSNKSNDIQNFVNNQLKFGAEKMTIHANTAGIEDPKGFHCYSKGIKRTADQVMEQVCYSTRPSYYFHEPISVSKLPLNCKTGIIDDDLGISAKDVSGGQCTDELGLKYQRAINEFERTSKRGNNSHEITKK